MFPRLVFLPALFSVLSAAALETLPPPPLRQLTPFPGGPAVTPHFTVSCQGFRYPGDYLYVPTSGPGDIVWAESTFVGANPTCNMRGLAPLPGLQSHYLSPVPFPRFAQVLFQQVWPGIDVLFDFDGARLRLAFQLESASRLPQLQIRLDQTKFLFGALTDLLRWSTTRYVPIQATATASSATGPVPLLVDSTLPAPFQLRAPSSGPIEILLEATYPPDIPFPLNVLRTSSGERYESEGQTIRKFAADGVPVFEATLRETVASLTLGPDDALYAFGNYGNFIPFQRASTPGLFSVSRLDSRTGRTVFSTLIGGSLSQAGKFVGFHPSGALQLVASSNSSNFPRTGATVPNACRPAPPNGFTPGTFCSYAILLSPGGELLSSRPILTNTNTAIATSGRSGGPLYALRQAPANGPYAVEVIEPTGSPIATIPLPVGLTFLSLIADATGGFWLTAFPPNRGLTLFRYLDGSSTPIATIQTLDPSFVFYPLEDGGLMAISSYRFQPAAVPYPADALLPVPCPGIVQPELFLFDSAGATLYQTFLPPVTAIGNNSHPARFRGRVLTWDRQTLRLDQPPAPAVFCGTTPAGQPITSVAPGQVLQFAVGGVADQSPFKPLWRPGQALPADVRGWSVRFDGVPAPIHQLDQSAVTLSVPLSLSAPARRRINLTVWYQNHQLEERAIDLLPEIPTLYSAVPPFQPGQEIQLLVSGMAAAVSAVTDSGQAVAISAFGQSPVHPKGIFSLRLRLPEGLKPTRSITVSTPTATLTIRNPNSTPGV